jgi:hypothetical protein
VAAQVVAAAALLRPLGAVALVLFGIFKLLRPRSHPRRVGLRVGPRELVLWSFLMSSAHGAGLMLVPVLLGLPIGTGLQGLPHVGNRAGGRGSRHAVQLKFAPGECERAPGSIHVRDLSIPVR